jgi:hypothetical protein
VGIAAGIAGTTETGGCLICFGVAAGATFTGGVAGEVFFTSAAKAKFAIIKIIIKVLAMANFIFLILFFHLLFLFYQ